MGARSFRELHAWQLADELRRAIVAITTTPPASLDRRFCDQLRGAAASVSANIAEGYGCYSSADFARFVTIAKASLAETQDRLRDGVDRGHIRSETAADLLKLAARCDRVLAALRVYLWRAAGKSLPDRSKP